MRLLLDTHVLLWWLADDPGLSGNARALIASAESEVLVSAASAWEISIKRALGKLDAPDDLEAQLVQHNFSPLAISVGHALAAGALPRHHEDPFDRMLVAQAQLEGLTIATRDPGFEPYGVPTLTA
ncbi:MAG TPA: type II toxin-antitoxin system VapC family toxin [Candidatus Acidoferrales bacterium]|nr:type II toxin-antitoxin system VapC family toxin [Candidatus Acidoferrales bacterium]